MEPQLGDFGDLAVIIDQLDLVITVDTSVAHMAGALAKPTWLMLSYLADWRWMLDGESTLWYPTMRLFRHTRPGDWSGVIERVTEALSNQKQPEYRNPKCETNFNDQMSEQSKGCRFESRI